MGNHNGRFRQRRFMMPNEHRTSSYVKPGQIASGILESCPECGLTTAMGVETVYGKRAFICAACGYLEHQCSVPMEGRITYDASVAVLPAFAHWISADCFGGLYWFEVTDDCAARIISMPDTGDVEDGYLRVLNPHTDRFETVSGIYERKADDDVYARKCVAVAEEQLAILGELLMEVLTEQFERYKKGLDTTAHIDGAGILGMAVAREVSNETTRTTQRC